MQVVIIGGGAGGASCAARLRRLDDKANIVILEKTDETSIASCGLPYYIGGVIADREDMQVASPDMFKKLFGVEMRLKTEVVKINAEEKYVKTSQGEKISYDKLVLATGAKPFIPPILGLDNISHFVVKNLSDADKIKAYIAEKKPKSVAVIGGGFIGVEVAENMVHLGLKTSLVEMAEQVLPPLDKDMVCQIHSHMQKKGINLVLADGVKELNSQAVVLNSGKEVKADFVILAIGVRADTLVAKEAGVELLANGTIRTNEFMQTNYQDIYACGDSVAVKDFVSGNEVMIALAGPANRQGRLIADHITNHSPYPYNATQGTGIVKVFDLTAAFTGNNEKQLIVTKTPYKKMIINGASHAGYYPGAEFLTLKVLYNEAGKILGAQAVGVEGVDKRIDVIATIMRLKGSVEDLRDAELCYAPPYASAKDPINIMGMAILNEQQNMVKPFFGIDFSQMFVVDVRPYRSYEQAHIPNAINIPAAQLKSRLSELPKDKPILLYCFKGYTSYVGSRFLMANGFDNVYSYAGGMQQYLAQTK